MCIWFHVVLVIVIIVIFSLLYLYLEYRILDYLLLSLMFWSSMVWFLCFNVMLLFHFAWEMIGYCSLMLIGYWITRCLALRSALFSFIVNRFGDCFFIVGLCYCIEIVHGSIFIWYSDYLVLLHLFLLCIMSKSALWLFHCWLLLAMGVLTSILLWFMLLH